MTKTPPKQSMVGYAKPPKQHQFKKGRSGNPRGRRKKSRVSWRDTPTANDALNTEITKLLLYPLKNNQKVKSTLTGVQAIAMSIFKRAINGDKTATTFLLNHLQNASYRNAEREIELDKVDPKDAEYIYLVNMMKQVDGFDINSILGRHHPADRLAK